MILLLIACGNAANLQIARGAARISEMTVRSGLGASRSRLLQQIVTESVVVSLLGAAFGLLLSYGLVSEIRVRTGRNSRASTNWQFIPQRSSSARFWQPSSALLHRLRPRPTFCGTQERRAMRLHERSQGHAFPAGWLLHRSHSRASCSS